MAKPDWEAIESAYRAGLMSLREIASQHGISEGAGHWLAAYILGWDPKKIELKVPSSENSHYGYALCAYKVNLETICDVRDYGVRWGAQVVRILIFGKPKRYISFIIIALRVKVIGSTNLILL
ncbi:hypothetical protein [Klebsiella pneumoniae]|uniref:hypothetical protein n=1 Tax=Klebsiella pneumoniae TaxID=573 RepID=UPI001E4F363B|nr:hypothetical protein [Klebsiella pneumoniae]